MNVRADNFLIFGIGYDFNQLAHRIAENINGIDEAAIDVDVEIFTRGLKNRE